MPRKAVGATRVRVVALALVLALTVSLVAPAIAMAYTPTSTLALSTTYQYRATTFKISGYVGARYVGKVMRIEIRKPGRTWWSQVAMVKINKYGRWQYYYKPKLGGKFFIRARYGMPGTLSRIATLIVKYGPSLTSLQRRVLLSSTTSTRDSGLFERLGPFFKQMVPEYNLQATFKGSGAAIADGGMGNADVLLTHSPKAEVDFMHGIVAGSPSAYRGSTRYKVMYNDFLLVGPTANPAGVTLGESAVSAFGKIASTQSSFLSRNDNSGTNAKEKEIWALINPAPWPNGQPWYLASGTMGMAQALGAANNSSYYTLADRATWLNALNLQLLGTKPAIGVLNQGDAKYFNQYAVITVARSLNVEGGQEFSLFMRSPYVQNLIRTYGEYTYPGQIMFTPNAGPYPW